MYNKYLTMKKSQLKEAIKAEIKSVLSEDFNDDNRGLAYIKSDGERDGFESFTQHAGKQNLKNVPDLEAYTDGFAKGVMQKGNKLVQLISRATVGGADAEPLMKMIGLKEVYQTNSKMKQMVSLFQDMMADEYDGILVPDAFDDFMPKFFEAINKDYESAENFGEKVSNIREEDEPTAADLKKKDSVASISNKLQKLTAKMKKKAKEFKEAEGKAKDKLKDELKDMTAEKKKLEKEL